jgi:uncharacterized protein
LINIWIYLVGFGLFFFAAFTKGVLGFGVAIITVPLMSVFVGPKAAIALMSLPSMFNNFLIMWQWRDKDSLPLIRRITPILISGFIGIILGSFLLVYLKTEVIMLSMGLLTVLYVLTEKWRKDWLIPAHQERYWATPVGFLAGLLGGVSGISGPLLVAYLYSLKLAKHLFVYAMSTLFTLFTVAQVFSLLFLGVYTTESVLISLTYLVPLVIGTAAGRKAQAKVSQELFNRLVLITLFVVGLDLIRRGAGLF